MLAQLSLCQTCSRFVSDMFGNLIVGLLMTQLIYLCLFACLVFNVPFNNFSNIPISRQHFLWSKYALLKNTTLLGAAPLDQVVKSPDIINTRNHSIISLLCLVWVRAQYGVRETSQVLLVVVAEIILKGDTKPTKIF